MNRSQGFEETYETETPSRSYSKLYYSPRGFSASSPWSGTHATRQMEPKYKSELADGPGLSAEDYLSDSHLALQGSAPRNFNLFVSHPHSRLQLSPRKDVTWKPPRLMRSAGPSPHEVRSYIPYPDPIFRAAFPPSPSCTRRPTPQPRLALPPPPPQHAGGAGILLLPPTPATLYSRTAVSAAAVAPEAGRPIRARSLLGHRRRSPPLPPSGTRTNSRPPLCRMQTLAEALCSSRPQTLSLRRSVSLSRQN